MAVKNTGPEVVKWDDEFLVRRGNYVTLVTPEMAKAWLEERNTNNRRIKDRTVQSFAHDMKAGKWDPDASDIKFARTGELIDGQHRLQACVLADVPFPTLVRTGVGQQTRQRVDTGTRRSAADAIKMAGFGTYPTTMGACVNLRVRYDRFVGKKRAELDTYRMVAMTHDEVLEYLNEHPHIDRFAIEASSVRRMIPAIPPSVILTILSMGAERDEKMARSFADRIVHGEYGGTVGDPLVALIQYAATQRALQSGSPGARGRVTAATHLIAMLRVWNALRKEEPIEGRIHVKSVDYIPEML